MLINERYDKILNVLKQKRKVSVKELTALLFVSEATVRRDLTEMQKLGLIERAHGCAVISNNTEEVSHFVRIDKNTKEKEYIASLALKRLPRFGTVFLDGSSTAVALAERMNLEHKTVVTYNLQTAMQISKKPNVNLIILGGVVHYSTASAIGSWTASQINDFYFDLFISSCSAISNQEIYENSLEQKIIKQNALNKSTFKILLADHTKFESTPVYKSSNSSDYSLIVTDKKPVNFGAFNNLIY